MPRDFNIGTTPTHPPRYVELEIKTLDASSEDVAAGYYEAAKLSEVDEDLASGNIKDGVTIFGVEGAAAVEDVSDATATEGDVMEGETFYAGEGKLTGTMPTQVLSEDSDTVEAGYYEATTLSAVDTDLDSDNIKAGITIFGKAGKTEVVDTTEAVNPITAGVVLDGKIGFVNGDKITGTLALTGDAIEGDVLSGKLFYSDDPLTQLEGTLALTGDAEAGDVLDGKFFYKDDATDKIEGTLALTGDAGTGDVLDGKFFYKDDAKDKLEGTLALTGDAGVANVLSGKLFYKDDAKTQLEGTMPNNAGDVAAESYHRDSTSLHIVPAEGYTDGIDDATTITDANFIAANIKLGVTIFGLEGTYAGE